MLNYTICFKRLTVTVLLIVLLSYSVSMISTTCFSIKRSIILRLFCQSIKTIRDFLKYLPLALVSIGSIIVVILVVEDKEDTGEDEEVLVVEEEEVVVVVEHRSNLVFGLPCLTKTETSIKIYQRL